MQTPPRLADALLRLFLSSEDAEVISGDLDETFRTTVVAALRRARRPALVLATNAQHHRRAPAHARRGPSNSTTEEDDHGRHPAGSFVRAPVARQAAGIHRDGGADARDRDRRERRDLLARQRRAAQAAAVCGSRPSDDGAPALAGSRGAGRHGPDNLVLSEVSGASASISAASSRRPSFGWCELESDRFRIARARHRRTRGVHLLSTRSA